MKKLTILFVMVLVGTIGTFGQAIYTGGSGGGYATISLSTPSSTNGSIVLNPKVSVSPNPFTANQPISIVTTGFSAAQSVTIAVYSSIGNRVHDEVVTSSKLEVGHSLSLPTLKAGLYLLVISTDKQKRTVKLICR
ncbi:MAG: T9SS type A sorting domain-containing protein [Bacteroidales bacterium]|nr:T9SS type A sorting domain-containing protein [Bacteroidales bacterium]MBN2749735.1 T9SS type A sorting domain-containing protein [Bacteroidales bacterium]